MTLYGGHGPRSNQTNLPERTLQGGGFNESWKEYELIVPKQYNQDDWYKEALSSAIEFKHQSIQGLLAPMIGDVFPIPAMVQKGHFVVLESLLQMDFSTDLVDQDGFTPLMRASQQGQIQAIKLLLQAGTSAGHKDKDQNTSFILAICSHKIEAAELLLLPTKEAGAFDTQDIYVSIGRLSTCVLRVILQKRLKSLNLHLSFFMTSTYAFSRAGPLFSMRPNMDSLLW